jgi:hypothetical protein
MTKKKEIVLGTLAGLVALATLGAILDQITTGNGPLPAVSAAQPAASALADETLEIPALEPLDLLVSPEPRVFYQYVDERGRVRFVQTLHELPEAWRENPGRVESEVSPPESPAAARMMRKLRDEG